MSFSDHEGYTADGEELRRRELEEYGACECCAGRGVVDPINPIICPACDGSGYAVRPPQPPTTFPED